MLISISRLSDFVVTAIAVCVCACGTQDSDGPRGRVAVLSAFPAELTPLLEQATINETMVLGDRVFRVGVLAEIPVVLGLTGIGLVNAELTTQEILERFNVTGVVVSGVAGSSLRIGDVAVPDVWTLIDDTTYTADRRWLELVDEIAVSDNVSLEQCTFVPFPVSQDPVCLVHKPVIVVGGVGQSSDPFFNRRFPCLPKGGDVFGCDVAFEDAASGTKGELQGMRASPLLAAETPTVNDMETAAIAREVAVRGIPFIAFRAVSDGAGDPLGLPGFPVQFFVYYRLAARNAAATTLVFLERIAERQG
jgi:nucleoside phosphorylase